MLYRILESVISNFGIRYNNFEKNCNHEFQNLIWKMECITPYDVLSMKFSEELRWQGHYEYSLSSKGHNSHKNFLPIWCYIYITSFMIIGSVVSEELRWQDFGTDGRTDGQTNGRTDGRSDCTPRPAFAFGDAGKNKRE